jgi:hydroxymethylpyrimidine pyrophosphatase-like HAD family hydrolase
MYCRAIACDFDGTGATDGRFAPEAAGALDEAKRNGIATILATGRVLEELRASDVDFSIFDAVVAENGAILWLPASGRLLQLGDSPPEHLLGALRSRGIPFQAGTVVIGTWTRHLPQVIDLIVESGEDLQPVLNRGALMVLPSQVNKGTGVARALEELRRSEHNLVAFGDAENDYPLFRLAEVAVAARGSVPGIEAIADDRLTLSGGAGVARWIMDLLQRDCNVPTPDRQRLLIGRDDAGLPVDLPTSGVNVLLSGDPRVGKSWLAGLVIERLIERGYHLCIFDPEGDYTDVDMSPRTLRLGDDLLLPSPSALPRLFDSGLSIVLELSALPHRDKVAYLESALAQMEKQRAVTGLPHWTVIDEAHYFFCKGTPCTDKLHDATGNVLLVTYRPSWIVEEVHREIDVHLLTRTTIDDERYFATSLLQTSGPRDLAASEALAALDEHRAGLLQPSPRPLWQVFTPEERVTTHVHHGRRYLDAKLADAQAFHFWYVDGGTPKVAYNVKDFHAAIRSAPATSLRHHLTSGDFSRWAADALGDEQLAHALRRLEHAAGAGGAPAREEILALLEDRYELH